MKNLGLMVTIKAKPNKAEMVAKFLEDAAELAQKEDKTITWYSFRIDKDTFGIFDTFNDDRGREAHLTGELFKALSEKTEELLTNSPTLEKVDILSSK